MQRNHAKTMHYQRNHLSQVIFRVDYERVAGLDSTEKPAFSDAIASIYPHVTGKPTAEISVEVGPSGAGVRQNILGHQWDHRKTESGSQAVVLNGAFLSVEYGPNDYDHFPAFLEEIRLITGALIQHVQPKQIIRMGLRYINDITLQKGNALNWDGYIENNLAQAVLAGYDSSAQMIRSMHQVQTQHDDVNVLMNYGLFNPDYPNPLVRRNFIIDVDCSRTGPFSPSEIIETLERLNIIAEAKFEKCIGDQLRKEMGAINE